MNNSVKNEERNFKIFIGFEIVILVIIDELVYHKNFEHFIRQQALASFVTDVWTENNRD